MLEDVLSALVATAELPLLTPNAIGTILEAVGERAAVALAPSRDGLGTNVVACAPPQQLAVAFGEGRHPCARMLASQAGEAFGAAPARASGCG